MALETATYINGLVSTNPTASDNISQGDDHIRLLKSTIKATFPNITAAVTVTQDDLNALPGNLASIDAITDDLQDQVDVIDTTLLLKAPLASPSFTGNVTITDTDAGASAAPILTLLRDSASPAANDVLGQLRFNGRDSGGNSTIFGALDSIIIDPTNTSEDSVLRFRNMSAGTLSEAMRIDESNRMLIGTTSYLDGWSSGQNLVLAGDTAAGLSVHAGNNIGVLGFVRSGGTAGSVTAVTNGDTIAAINFAAADGTNTRINAARIAVGIDGAPGTNDMPGRIVFSTTPDGSSTITERLRINNAGALGLGGANFGTSGQYLKSNGNAAVPEWATLPSSGGMTLLGSASPTSGNTVSFSGLDLSSYVQLYVSVNNASPAVVNARLLIGQSTSDDVDMFLGGNLNALSDSYDGFVQIDLQTGMASFARNATALTSGVNPSNGIYTTPFTTASTSVAISWASASSTFDGGTIKVYGVK